MKSIALLIPYFGKWPAWMPLFLDSIERNETIDFHFITDCDTSISTAKNIYFHPTSFEAYVANAEKKIGAPINVPNAYKICDLRPFFGIIHHDIIKNYDFYGWTDTDIFFGNIRQFYTNDLLNKYEVLSSHKIRLAGHLALLRTTKKYTQLGYKVYDWQKAVKNPNFVGIDEHGMTNALCMTFWDKIFEKLKLSTDNFVLNALRKWKKRKYYFVEQYSTPFTPIPWLDGSINSAQPDTWFYHQGTITNDRDGDRKFMYLHLMNFKSSLWRADGTEAIWKDNNYLGDVKSKIIITLTGIYYASK